MPNGSGSPCIDLSRLHDDLAAHCCDVDLVVLEGMGRAIHTNYDARLRCDCLKIAMIKNQWLAHRFGGKIYDVVCRFDPAPTTVVPPQRPSPLNPGTATASFPV
jgi:type II pantothenate kinase